MPHVQDLFSRGVNVISTSALATSLIAATTMSVYYGCDGYNSSGSTLYYFVFDSATVPPNNATVTPNPKHVIAVSTATNFSHGPAFFGELFVNGITIVASTTAYPNLTIAGSTSFIACDYAREDGSGTY